MDFPYEFPPLVCCCFGAARREFITIVRVSGRQAHPDQYSTWKELQWARRSSCGPRGPPSNVAVAHTRLGDRAAFMGKVGDDEFGNDLVYRMNTEKVQTRAVKIDPGVKTAASRMRIEFREEDGGGKKRMVAETVKECTEDSLSRSEIDVSVLKEARIFHFNQKFYYLP